MKKWGLILLILLLTLPGYALITIEKKPGTGTLAGHLDDINANDLELDGKIADKVSDDAFTSDWGTVTDVAPSQAALYNYLSNFDTDGDGLFSDEAWFPSIFDPAVPGEIGGTTASAGTFTDLTAETLTLTPTDGENRLTFPENTSRTPATGAEEIFNEGGLMKYSENGVKKNFVTIDDTAGTGDTTVTLSADKIVELILSGGSGVPDGTDTNDILSWDGDSWEPIALSSHPEFASLLAAFNNAGLNSFSFTPNNSFPLWIDGDGVTLSVDVTDTSTTYAVDTVNYQLDGAGGFVNALTNTSGNTWTTAFDPATDGTYTVQYRAADDKSTPNTGDSATYTIYRDATLPIGVADADSTHNGTDAFTAAITVTEDNLDAVTYSVTNTTPASGSCTLSEGKYVTPSLTPSSAADCVVTFAITDLAGNSASGTDLVQAFTYSGGASNPDYQWNLDDNAASTTILAAYGGVNGVLVGSGNTSDAQTGDGFQLGASGGVSISMPSAVFTGGSWTIQAAFDYTNAPSSQWPRLFSESSGANRGMVWWDTVTHTFRIYLNAATIDSTNTIDISDGVKRWFRLVWNASNTTVYLYSSTDKSSWSLVVSASGSQPTTWGGSTYVGYSGGSGFFRGIVDDVSIYESAVLP